MLIAAHLAFAAAVIPSLLAHAGPFRADCGSLDGTSERKIVIGDVHASGDTQPSDVEMSLLQIRIQQRTEEAAVELRGLLKTVLCPGHQPDPSDYTNDILRILFESRVMVELWGITEPETAIFKYAIIPLAHVGEKAFYSAGYAVSPQRNLAALFDEPVELKAYALLALGAFEMRQLDQLMEPPPDAYHRAKGVLCRARTMTEKAAAREDPLHIGPTAQDWKVLHAFAEDSVGEVLTRAFQDQGYVGSLKPPGAVSPLTPDTACDVSDTASPIPYVAENLR